MRRLLLRNFAPDHAEQSLTPSPPLLRQANNPIPGPLKTGVLVSKKPKPLLALTPLVHPLLLRFKWQFEGDRSTNRIDKVRIVLPVHALP